MIGVFDSGLGGLSVLAAIARALPRADLLYLADTAHVPYGDKPEGFITGRVLAIGKHLADQGCDLIVVACNTATTTAIQALRDNLPGVPVVGVEPGVKPAAQASRSHHIAVLVTTATAKSQRLAQLIKQHANGTQVAVVPCPGWATHVETLQADTPALRAAVAAKIEPLVAAGVDQIVLGCTHYAFLTPLIAPLLNEQVELVDVAAAVARQVVRLSGEQTGGQARLILQATAYPERLRAALPALGLQALAERSGPAHQVTL
ncbi:MAG: glutamate racemase [Rhodocyclaceae bacterium]|nr:glutamate racemase [Rhodocyclaceae bacterium]